MSPNNSAANAALIAAISQMPPEWALTLCVGKKNLWPQWSTVKLDRSLLIDAIANQRNHAGKYTAWTGVSLVTGPLSGGVMAIDFDGEAALGKYLELSGGEPIPVTRMWTSGKPGHFQILLRVPQAQWSDLKPLKFHILNAKLRENLGLSQEELAQRVGEGVRPKQIAEWESGCLQPIPAAIGKKIAEIFGMTDTDPTEKLEFRWNQCSTLPSSIHPDTKAPYYWENWDESYDWENWEEFVPIAPDWVLELMRGSQQSPVADTRQLSQILLDDILPRLDALSFYGEYVKLKKVGKNFVGLCPLHSEKTPSFTVSLESKTFCCFGCSAGGGPVQFLHQIGGGTGSPSGKDFVEVVRQLAARVGVKIPDRASDRVEPSKPQKQPINNNRVSLQSEPVNLRAEIQEIYDTNLIGSRLSEAIMKLAKNGNSKEIWRLYYEVAEEIETEETRVERSGEVLSLLSIGERRFALGNCLHPSLAEPINKVANWMGVDPESVLTHLLPITAGLIDPHSRIIAKECINFAEPFLLYTGVSALSGSRKTPLLNLVKSPLVALQACEDLRHSEALRQYEEECQAFKKSKNNDNPPPEPPRPPREFYVDNITTESIDKIKGQQPDCGLSLIKDELSGLIASHGAYKGGKGSDKESFLSGWNGGGIKKNRCGDGSRVSLSHDSLSITGGIQPDKIRSLLGDFTDAQGEWARFLWYHQPMRPYKIPRNNSRYDLGELLESIYRKILELPALKLRFDRQGQTYFDDWHDEKDEHKRRETKPGLQAAIAKMPGQAVRLIGLLHILWEIAEGNTEVRATVPLEIVKAGCDLAEFYLGQVTKLQSDGEVPEPTPIFTALLEKAKEVGSLTASQAKKAIWCLRKETPDKIRQLFQELAQMGLASIEGAGCKLKLVSNQLRDFFKIPASAESRPQPPESLTNSEEFVCDRPAVEISERMGSVGLDRAKQPQPFTSDQTEQLAQIEDNFEESPTSHDNLGSSTAPVETLTQQDSESVEEFRSGTSILPEVEETFVSRLQAAQTWAECEAVWGTDTELKAQIKAALPREELARIGKLFKSTQQQTESIAPEPEPETITPEDAEKIRDIALILWDEYYPKHTGSLIAQMFSWQSPGQKYSQIIINQWLETEDELVRDRITQLFNLKNNSIEEAP
ncbi:DUF3987 domain-containing protein [Microcoleus sp. herbarium7]|uniref:DUF3987 domain-containing protein n=1 Tax=Microcoleus sp. herbarium7 TaxID=3055435 RepID=UPI002FD3D9A8